MKRKYHVVVANTGDPDETVTFVKSHRREPSVSVRQLIGVVIVLTILVVTCGLGMFRLAS